jgi:hypothetical protein
VNDILHKRQDSIRELCFIKKKKEEEELNGNSRTEKHNSTYEVMKNTNYELLS